MNDVAKSEAQNPAIPTPLRFPALRGKRAPKGFIHIDQALDLLGAQRWPEGWGRSSVWSEAPFKYNREDRRFYTYFLVRKSNGEYRLDFEEKVTRGLRADMKYFEKTYKSVRREFTDAVKGGHIKSSKLFKDGFIKEIHSNQTEIFSSQLRSIYYTGYARDIINGIEIKFRLLIEELSFYNWIGLVNTRPDGLKSPPSERTLQEIGETIASRAQLNKYVPTKKKLYEVVAAALEEQGYELSERKFEAVIWKHQGETTAKHGGRRGQDNLRLFENDIENIIAAVQAICGIIRRPIDRPVSGAAIESANRGT